MGVYLALVVGYMVGAKTRGKDLEQLSQSLKALTETEEFSDVILAVRTQAANTLRGLASSIEGGQDPAETSTDLVTRVRHLVSHE